MSTTIKATAHTFLKNLSDTIKFSTRKDTTLVLSDISGLDKKHYEVVLKEPLKGFEGLKGRVFAPHWGIVESNDPDLKKETFEHENPAVARQITRLATYSFATNINLDIRTRYFGQRDNYTMPHRTCNSSSNAMYLDWLLRVTGKKPLSSDNDYLRKVLKNGDTIYHHIQTETIAEYGFNTKWMVDADLDFVEDLIDTGFPVVVNILHRGTKVAPRGGHVILLIGRKQGYWIAHDPYGTLESNYSMTEGQYSRISEREFAIRWQGGYRILK